MFQKPQSEEYKATHEMEEWNITFKETILKIVWIISEMIENTLR